LDARVVRLFASSRLVAAIAGASSDCGDGVSETAAPTMATMHRNERTAAGEKSAMGMKVIDELDLAGKRVFIRVDYNVPLAGDGGGVRITDDSRIRASLPTVRHAIERGARVILASHLGRPKGKPDPRQSLAPAAARLGELLGQKVALAPDCIGPEVEQAVAGSPRATCCCSRTFASTPRRRRTIPVLRARSPLSPTCT
jgi:hypothetical protein